MEKTARVDSPLSPIINDDDQPADVGLRPRSLLDYRGQPIACEQLKIFISAARQRNEPLDHVLIFGPPGLGKTTLAYILANEMGSQMRQTSGPAIERQGDLVALLTNLQEGDVLFIDEIHRLNPVVEEILYPAMEDFRVDIIIGEGPAARAIKLNVPRFTLVGATTRAGLLTSPLRDRFGIVERLEFYSAEDLSHIVVRSAKILDIVVDASGAQEIARRARGTPRIANRLLRRVRDFAQVKGENVITQTVANKALDLLRVDNEGIDSMDRRLLEIIMERFGGGPVGLDSLASSIGEDKGTIEEVLEPYLVQQGFILRTPRGRIAGKRAWRHFGIKPPESFRRHAPDLFPHE